MKYIDLVSYLAQAGLDDKLAKLMSPRKAFSRACRKLVESRVIRKVEETEDELCFQFTREDRKSGQLFDYWMETLVWLNKKTGVIKADLDHIRDKAQQELDQAMEDRTGSDVSGLVMEIFRQSGDLFPISGNVWFIPEKNLETVRKVTTFLEFLKQGITRFPVPKGSPEGDKSVREVVTRGLQKLIEEHKKSIESFVDSTRSGTLEKTVDRINETRFKVEAYAELLASSKESLETELQECKLLLKKKIMELNSTPEGVIA